MPVYHDEIRNTYFISASYTLRKGVYKKLVRRGFKKRKDAVRMERILMANIEDNVRRINNMSLILDDLWNDYLEYMKLTEWKGNTANSNISKYKNHIQPVFGQRNVLQIEKKEIVDFHTRLINKGLCKSSVNGIHATFSGLYTYINDVYDIDYHPLSKVGFIKSNQEDKKKEIVILETDDFIRFVDAVEDTEMKLIFRTFYSTGLRISELQNLKWTDFKKKSLNIHKVTKSKNSHRIVPIDQELNDLLTCNFKINGHTFSLHLTSNYFILNMQQTKDFDLLLFYFQTFYREQGLPLLHLKLDEYTLISHKIEILFQFLQYHIFECDYCQSGNFHSSLNIASSKVQYFLIVPFSFFSPKV